MNQGERRQFLIEELLRERPSCRRQEIPADADRQKVLLRSLMKSAAPLWSAGNFWRCRMLICMENWQMSPGCPNCPRCSAVFTYGVTPAYNLPCDHVIHRNDSSLVKRGFTVILKMSKR